MIFLVTISDLTIIRVASGDVGSSWNNSKVIYTDLKQLQAILELLYLRVIRFLTSFIDSISFVLEPFQAIPYDFDKKWLRIKTMVNYLFLKCIKKKKKKCVESESKNPRNVLYKRNPLSTKQLNASRFLFMGVSQKMFKRTL